MSTSENGYIVRLDESLVAGGDFADTGILRSAVSNLNHAADQVAQARVHWTGEEQDTDQYFTWDTYEYPDSPTLVSGTWYPLWVGGPFDLNVREDGTSYAVRVSIRAHSNHASNSANFAIGIVPQGDGDTELLVSGAPNFYKAWTITGTTFSWVDASQTVYLDEAQVARATRGVSTVDSVGGVELEVPWLRCMCWVWGQYTSSAEARLGGVYAAEFLTPS